MDFVPPPNRSPGTATPPRMPPTGRAPPPPPRPSGEMSGARGWLVGVAAGCGNCASVGCGLSPDYSRPCKVGSPGRSGGTEPVPSVAPALAVPPSDAADEAALGPLPPPVEADAVRMAPAPPLDAEGARSAEEF